MGSVLHVRLPMHPGYLRALLELERVRVASNAKIDTDNLVDDIFHLDWLTMRLNAWHWWQLYFLQELLATATIGHG